MGSVVKAKVGDMEEKMRVEGTRRIMKEVLVCVKSVMGKNKFSVKFKYGQKKEMRSCSILLNVRKRRLIWTSHYQPPPKNNKANC